MTADYHLMMYARLKPRTAWTGGRITGIDNVTLDDAARFASKHAGVEILPADFLRAAARGEILLRACCPRTVTMQPRCETDEPLHIVENSLPTLPLAACKALSNGRPAQWRTYEEIKIMEAFFGKDLCRFTRWELPKNEPDLITTAGDCRVTGRDVHALADAYIETPATDTATPKLLGTKSVSKWIRSDLLTPLIEKAQLECLDPYNASEVWVILQKAAKAKTPPFIDVLDEGLKWVDSNDTPKVLTISHLRDRLSRQKKTSDKRAKTR